MSIQLNTNFNLKASIPIDTRFVFNSKSEMLSLASHDAYKGLLTYVVSEDKFYVFNGATFKELRVDNDYFLNPVATVSDLASIVSPKVGAVCMVKDTKRFYTFTGDTSKVGEIVSGDILTVTDDSVPLTVELISSDNADDLDQFPADVDLSSAQTVTRDFVNGWQLVANSANEISYDNLSSGLMATDVQSAIDELKIDIANSTSDSGYQKPVQTQDELDNIINPKPGDMVTIIEENKIYIYDGTEWVELKSGSEYFIDPVETKELLPAEQKNGTVCLVRSERIFYIFVEDATAEEQEIEGGQVAPAWIPIKSKSENITFDNSSTTINSTNISDAIIEVNNNITETTILKWDKPTTLEVGGIKLGYQTPEDGISISEFLYNMTHPFVYPKLTMTLTTGAGVFEKNTSKTLSKIVITSTAGSKPTFEENVPEIYFVNTLMSDSSDTVTVSEDKMTYTRELAVPFVMDGLTDKTVKATLTINGEVITAQQTYEFINPFYAASITANTISEYNNSLFIDRNKILSKKSNQIVQYTHDNKLMAFAYPSEYGALSKILDQNGFDITSTFTTTTFMYNSVSFRVYCSNALNTLTGFSVTFKF